VREKASGTRAYKRPIANRRVERLFPMKQYMVIERFKDGCWEAAYERFNVEGRLLPKGLNYLNSWANRDRSVCYQLM